MRWPLLLGLGGCLLTGVAEPAPPAKGLDPGQSTQAGRELVAAMLAHQPEHDYTNAGVLKIRNAQGQRTELPLRFEIRVTQTHWETRYEATVTNHLETFWVVRAAGQPQQYALGQSPGGATPPAEDPLWNRHPDLTTAFAGSDFWLTDLVLEFLNWPDQKVLRTELRKTRSCKVLESLNPRPSPRAYARVVSWIDTESLGILHADAYDAAGERLKEFDPKTVKEVNGEPQLVKMEMENRRTRSRSQIEFNVDAK